MFGREIVFFLFTVMLVKDSNGNFEEDMWKRINHSNGVEKTLSRKRRYLTFPSGSSLQLVYCLTMPSVGVGEIFTFGITAALAWELPSSTDELLMSFGKKPITTTTTTEAPTTLPPHHDVESSYHQDLSDHPSQRKGGYGSPNHIFNDWTYNNDIRYPAPVKTFYDPFRLKQSYKYKGYTDSNVKFDSSRKMSPFIQNTGSSKKYFNNEIDSYIHPVYHQIHRRTRRALYGKLEKLLSALSKDGKACLKKAICEVNKVPEGKGTLYQELMKTIFRIKPHEDYVDEDDYDTAANKSHNCTDKYPSCKHSVWTDMF